MHGCFIMPVITKRLANGSKRRSIHSRTVQLSWNITGTSFSGWEKRDRPWKCGIRPENLAEDPGYLIKRSGRKNYMTNYHRVCFLLLLRSEEHTSELQSLMRISYAVFCLKKKNKKLH